MTGKLKITATIAAAAAILFSCGKNGVENTYSRQDSTIESLVQSLAPEGSEATVEYFDGPVRVTVAHGDGNVLESGGTVTFLYAGHILNGTNLNASNLFMTNNKEFAESSNWTVTDSTIFQATTVNLADDTLVKGLAKGIVGVKAGDECYIMFNGKYGFGKHTTGIVPGNSGLVYHLWIDSVSN